MLDRFDLALLRIVQCDDTRTADSLAREIPLSASAIARRLRRLRREGWIARSIALLSPRLTQNRVRAVILIRVREIEVREMLERQLRACEQVQLCYEIAGPYDLVALFDCENMAEFGTLERDLLAQSQGVLRYDSYFLKREVKFAPFVALKEPG